MVLIDLGIELAVARWVISASHSSPLYTVQYRPRSTSHSVLSAVVEMS